MALTSTHLLQISAAWLAKLPRGVLVDGWGRTTGSDAEADFLAGVGSRRPLVLVLDDTVTAAAVAARIVGPWLDTDPDRRIDVPSGMSSARSLADSAAWMDLLTSDQLDTLASLARAAMEEG